MPGFVFVVAEEKKVATTDSARHLRRELAWVGAGRPFPLLMAAWASDPPRRSSDNEGLNNRICSPERF